MKVILILLVIVNIASGAFLLSMGSVFAAFSFAAAGLAAVVLGGYK
jgi:hypothetical protein